MTAARVAALLLVVPACGGGPESARIEGEVAYGGAVRGPLVVTAWPAFPPTGEPLASLTVEEPRFPQRYALEVPAGRVFVLVMVDVGAEDGFRYHSRRDAGGAWPDLRGPAAIHARAGAVARADVRLRDPAAGLPSP